VKIDRLNRALLVYQTQPESSSIAHDLPWTWLGKYVAVCERQRECFLAALMAKMCNNAKEFLIYARTLCIHAINEVRGGFSRARARERERSLVAIHQRYDSQIR